MSPVRPTDPDAHPIRRVLRELLPYGRKALGFSAWIGVLSLAPSVYMLEVYDRVVNSRSVQTLVMETLLVMAAFVLLEVLEWSRAGVLHAAGRHWDERMRQPLVTAVFDAVLRRMPGGSIQPINDMRTLREFVSSPAVTAVLDAPVAVLFLLLVFAVSPTLGWFSLVAALLQTALGWINERSTQPPLSRANAAAVQAQQYADASLRNAEVIEALGMIRAIHGRWLEKQSAFLQWQAQASQSAGFYQALSKAVQQVVSSALLGLGAWLFLSGHLPGGPSFIIVASILGGKVLTPLIQLVAQWQQVVNARVALARLAQLLTAVPPRTAGMSLPPPQGDLRVEAVVAGPPGSPVPVLRGLHFALQPGEILAVVGPSASGKSTLARVLVGLWPCVSGKVRLSGADVATWDKSELGPHVGYLPQGVELLDGTVEDNICRFAPPDPDRLREVTRQVGLHEFIESLPQGYQTPVGRDGAVLSGGQRQRVALARALYGRPALVVLDEPNASLDEQGDAALLQALLAAQSQGTTVVVVTHRTAVLSVCQKMLVLRDGQQQLFGPRDEVLAALRGAAPAATALPPAATVEQGQNP